MTPLSPLVPLDSSAGSRGHSREAATEDLRESEARLRALLSSLDDLVFELDNNGFYLSIWTTNEALLVAPISELRGKSIREVLGGQTAREMIEAIHRVLETGRAEIIEYRLEVPAGHLWFQGRLSRIVRSGSTPSACLLVRDITERNAEAQLRDSEASFRLMFEQNPNPMWLYDVTTLQFVKVNDAAVSHYGYSRNEFLAMGIMDIRPSEDVSALQEDLASRAAGLRDRDLWRHLTKAGETIDVEVSAHDIDIDGRRCRLVMSQDVTDRLRAERDLLHQSFYDTLTGLPNRALFLDRLNQELAHERGRVPEGRGALHRPRPVQERERQSGSRSRRFRAQRSRRTADTGRQERETVARFGGDEYILIIRDVHGVQTDVAAAKRLLGVLDSPIHCAGQDVTVTGSIGIAIPGPGADPATVLRDADTAMYEAKAAGRNRCAVFDEVLHHRFVTRLRLEGELRLALDHDEFEVYYQPRDRACDWPSDRSRGAHPLAPPEKGIGTAFGLHSRGGRLRTDQAHRKLGVREGSFPTGGMGQGAQRTSSRYHGHQRVCPAARRSNVLRTHPRLA